MWRMSFIYWHAVRNFLHEKYQIMIFYIDDLTKIFGAKIMIDIKIEVEKRDISIQMFNFYK